MIPLSDEEKQKIIRMIHAIVPDAKIILFGSYAQGRATHGSDLDLALDVGKPIPRRDVMEVQDILAASNIYHIVDIVDYHGVSESLREEIQKEGIAWTNL